MISAKVASRSISFGARWGVRGRTATSTYRYTGMQSVAAFQDYLLTSTLGSYSDSRSSAPMPQLISARFFSTTPPEKDDDEKEQDSSGNIVTKTLRSIMTPQNQFYALVAGGAVGTYAISRVFLGITSFFTHLNPSVVAKWGFYTGFGCASMVGGIALLGVENLYIRADPVYKYCFNWVSRDTAVQKSLGDGLKPGDLRSYRLDSGKIEMVGTKPVWRPPRIQMIFDVTATGPPYRTGLVTCEAIKYSGLPPKLSTALLKVDFETGNEGEGGSREEDQTIFLKGSQEDLTRVSRRSGLSLEKLARSVHINRAAAGRQE